MYKVIRFFRDALDNRYAYNVGDTFPHDGRSVSQERINALLSGNNKQQVPLIKYMPDAAEKKAEKVEKKVVKEEEKAQDETLSKADIKAMPYFKLKSVAKEYGIDVKDKKVDEIRKELMEKL